jgi:hypothetical protein
MTWCQTFEDIELILNFPRVNEIEYLKKDEEIEYHGHVNWGTIHLKNITHVYLFIFTLYIGSYIYLIPQWLKALPETIMPSSDATILYAVRKCVLLS